MNDFILYIKQRFHLGIFLLLTLFLLLFSKNSLLFIQDDISHFFLILFFLFIMRLYDDLKNATNDREKKNRIYTNLKAQKKLTFICIVLLISFLFTVFILKAELLKYVSLFFLINHLLYKLLFHFHNIKSYLPLIKYPLVSMALLGEFNWACIALFLAMVVFEILEDTEFPIHKKHSYLLAVIAISLLVPIIDISYVILLLFMLSLTIFLLTKKSKWTPYLFLFVFLITRLITISNEI